MSGLRFLFLETKWKKHESPRARVMKSLNMDWRKSLFSLTWLNFHLRTVKKKERKGWTLLACIQPCVLLHFSVGILCHLHYSWSRCQYRSIGTYCTIKVKLSPTYWSVLALLCNGPSIAFFWQWKAGSIWCLLCVVS